MSFLHGSDFAFLGHLSVQQDTLLDVFCCTLHGPSSFLPVTGFSWKATPSTGIPQSSGRCCGARQSPSRASPKSTLYPDHVTLRDDAFHLAHVRPNIPLHDNLFVVNALEPDGSPFDVKPLGRGGAQFIQRTEHCVFDRGNLRILSCFNPRVLSFRGVVRQFFRGIFFPKRVIMPLKSRPDRASFPSPICPRIW